LKIELDISPIEYAALQGRAAYYMLNASPQSVALMARKCIVEFLALEDRLDQQLIIDQITSDATPNADKPTTNGLIEAAKARQNKRIESRVQLELPRANWKGAPTSAWKIFCWLARTMLKQKAWHSFIVDNAAQDGAIDKKNAYDGISRLISLGWLYESGTTVAKTPKGDMEVNTYSVSEAGKRWLMDRSNQIFLMGEGIIEAPEQDNIDE